MTKIKIGIVGYGNLGRGVERGLKKHADMELVGIFSRRHPDQIKTTSPVYLLDEILDFKDKIDVLILCGGSKSDIPTQGPTLAKHFNTVDSYDTHELIPEYFQTMNQIAKENENVSVVATGWDPGLFSMNRLFQEAILPEGETYTFWGRGVSQGHSDAVRGIAGVAEAAQYTVPDSFMISQIKKGEQVDYSPKKAHTRDVYVVLTEEANPSLVEETIKQMPDYFEGYKTSVNFISQKEFDEKHRSMPHGGRVVRRANTSEDELAVMEFTLNLDSNPDFTAAVSIAYARAAYKLAKEQNYGARTVLDIAPFYLSAKSKEELMKDLL